MDSSDHNQLHFNSKIKSDKTKVKQCRRDFRKGNCKEIRKRLAHIDWNDKMKNKTATECWNILIGCSQIKYIFHGQRNLGNAALINVISLVNVKQPLTATYLDQFSLQTRMSTHTYTGAHT